jgi:hypothetical protein
MKSVDLSSLSRDLAALNGVVAARQTAIARLSSRCFKFMRVREELLQRVMEAQTGLRRGTMLRNLGALKETATIVSFRSTLALPEARSTTIPAIDSIQVHLVRHKADGSPGKTTLAFDAASLLKAA